MDLAEECAALSRRNRASINLPRWRGRFLGGRRPNAKGHNKAAHQKIADAKHIILPSRHLFSRNGGKAQIRLPLSAAPHFIWLCTWITGRKEMQYRMTASIMLHRSFLIHIFSSFGCARACVIVA
jgi:hypothetical protein